ncbi:MAG: zinc ribbon domain-containing protein [Erysipelotrichaceae bacterium]|nr:zinc ribbon domain-containing protein [Erysipelotrichaceae bacterium]
MRCDVCGYKIVPGQHECPNCGYKWDDGHVNTFDRTAYDHGHIQNKPKSQVKQPQRKTIVNPKSTIEKNKIIPTLIKIFIGLWIVGMLAGVVVTLVSQVPSIFDDIFEEDDTYTSSSIEEAIEYGYDYENVLQREEDVIAFFESLGFTDIDTYDYVGTGTYVSFTVYAYDDDYTMYEIGETYMDEALYETTFVTSGYLENSIQSGDLTIDKDMIDAIDDYIECGNLYDMINVYRSQMSLDDDGYLYYDNDIYFSEDYEDYDGTYYYYFSIDF